MITANSMTSFQICLAPMRGLTDLTFRNVYQACFSGVDEAIAPFLSTVEGTRIKPSHIRELVEARHAPMPVTPQILGNSPEQFIVLAETLFRQGYSHVNWNLGCPFPKVAKKKRGSGLLPYPDLVEAFLQQVFEKIEPNGLSIKLRLGYASSREIFDLLPILNRYPLKELIIHPRTGHQRYEGCPDLDTFEKCLDQTDHGVVYNGDIATVEDFERLRRRFPHIARWMIGRGILWDPLLPERIKACASREKPIKRLRLFHDRLYDAYAYRFNGPAHLIERMKGFWVYFSRAFKDGPQVFKRIRRAKTPEQYQNLTGGIFEEAVYLHSRVD